MKRVFAFLCLMLAAVLGMYAQNNRTEVGSVINGKDGKPAGIVFHYDSATGTGYMVSLADAMLAWNEKTADIELAANYINSAVAGGDFNGLVNTAAIVSQLGIKQAGAAGWCFEYAAGGLSGWYLPSCGELNILFANRAAVNQALAKVKGTAIANAWHWSSSEGDQSQAWSINFSGGDNYPDLKTALKRVRAIRKF